MKRSVTVQAAFLACLLFCLLPSQNGWGQTGEASMQRPNVLLIMVDDLGFSDLGCYGSEIETPHLDALAANGLRFSQFYNTAKCHSSRVSLLTGQYCIAAGDTSLSRAVTSAETLGAQGYYTAMAGKWHLQKEPTDFGFQRYFGHLSGACNYFLGDNTFRLDGQPWSVPSEGFYTTVANVDHAMKFLHQADEADNPWFLYVAFNAPHAPLQALPQDYAKYEGRYDQGWDVIHQRRAARQKELGITSADLIPSERPDHIPAWDSLSDPRKEFETKRMTALAAMIDRVDQETGRLIEHLEETGDIDNTLIWFVSDNGACPYDRTSQKIEAKPTDGTVSWSDSTGWAWARNTPFRLYKQNQFEGGISTPAIVHWPKGLKPQPGSINHTPAHLIDIFPTMVDVTGSMIPSEWLDRQLRPVSGVSLRPIFEGGSFQRDEPLHFLFSSDRGLREDNWKLASFRNGPWELYDLNSDRTERHNVADNHPIVVKRMAERWNQMATDVLHTRSFSPTADVSPGDAASTRNRHPEWTDFSQRPQNNIRGNGRNKKKSTKSSQRAIRARKNTTSKWKQGVLHLSFHGDDPGIAMDRLPSKLDQGPYHLAFELQSNAAGQGDVFFTTSPDQSLPNGVRLPWTPKHDDQWHAYSLALVNHSDEQSTSSKQEIHRLRLDTSDAKGSAKIRNLRVLDASGEEVIRWDGNTTPANQ
ncbi:arylsulfatase [Rhodopirellula halodulae]|uniref:arylsulfatase n=1 Tax=Rhodopirellula halodulae TaxID=2894198 RepID=UPI0036F19C14